MFLSAMLQRDPMVRRGTDICRLLARRLQRWKDHCFEDLVNETERCARRLPRSRFKDEKDRCVKVFTHLMLRGQVLSAVRFITDRVHGGGVLSLDASTGVPGHPVLDILREKHPEPGVIDESAFMSCDDLPPLLDLDITADYVEHVAHQIQGSSGPCGSTALQWHGYLLRHGVSSACLRDAVAMLAHCLANGIVDWESIRALMASRLIALDKCPGVRPIGVGEALRRILCKVIALATRTDLEDVCGIAQLCSGCGLVWREQFMLFMSCLICTVMTVGEFCLLMHEMYLIQLIVLLHYGMLEFFGRGVPAFSSTPTVDMLGC